MNNLQIINIDGVECYEKDGTAYLKLETVARGLGFTRDKNGTEYVMWDRVMKYLTEIGFHTCAENGVPTCGHDDFIPENVFYRLAMKAKNEVAEKFQAKVADEIIPSIRKTGGYQMQTPQGKELLALAVLEAQKTIEEQTAQIERMKPKEIFADAVSASDSSILVRDMAKILKQNGVNIGEKRLYKWLRDKGYLIKKEGKDHNSPTQRSMDMKLFEVAETVIQIPGKDTIVKKTSRITGKGQQYFLNKFLENGVYQ